MPPQASLPVQEIQFIDESNTGTPQALTAAIAAAIGTRNAAGSNSATGNITLNMTTAGVAELVIKKQADYNVQTQSI